MGKLPQTSSTSPFLPRDVQLALRAPVTQQGPEKQECGHYMGVKGQKINDNDLIGLDTGHHFPQGVLVRVKSLRLLSYLQEEKVQPGCERELSPGNCTWRLTKGCRSFYFFQLNISARMGWCTFHPTTTAQTFPRDQVAGAGCKSLLPTLCTRTILRLEINSAWTILTTFFFFHSGEDRFALLQWCCFLTFSPLSLGFDPAAATTNV